MKWRLSKQSSLNSELNGGKGHTAKLFDSFILNAWHSVQCIISTQKIVKNIVIVMFNIDHFLCVIILSTDIILYKPWKKTSQTTLWISFFTIGQRLRTSRITQMPEF